MPSASMVHYPFARKPDAYPVGPVELQVYEPQPQPALAAQFFSNKQDEPGSGSNMALFNAICSADDAVGRLVYAVNGVSDAVKTADSDLPYPVVGVIISKSDATHALVQRYGPVYGLFSGLQTQVRYFVHHTGTLVAPPFGPDSDVRFVQQVGYALSATAFFIQPTGTVIQRDTGVTVFKIGNGAPQDGQEYPLQDMYVDQDTGAFSFTPAADNTRSNIYAGHGAPQVSQGVVYDAYFDQDGDQLYLMQESNNGISDLIVGHGPPTGNETPTGGTYFFDSESGSLYPETT